MSWIPWVVGGVVVVIAGWFLISKISGSQILKRRQTTIKANIKELEKEKEAADVEREDRRNDALDADPFD